MNSSSMISSTESNTQMKKTNTAAATPTTPHPAESHTHIQTSAIRKTHNKSKASTKREAQTSKELTRPPENIILKD
jgi:hypothetical protein